MRTVSVYPDDDDYGVYGKGPEGFLLYQQAVDDAYRGGGGGGGNRGGGFGWLIILAVIVIVIQIASCTA